ncbi:MAG: hypothetical protein JWM69_1020, partial [Candidatus Binatus sp.]|nr:hypothetical protein [Candidatus Binatus sp.]
MFASEHRKQKAFFAAADIAALAFAVGAALTLHDPGGAMQSRLLESSWLDLTEGGILISLIWLFVFRAFDLYEMRNGGRKETKAVIKACSV